jgi:hypothetical protein
MSYEHEFYTRFRRGKLCQGRSISVSIESGYGRSRFDLRQRRKDFSSTLCVQTGSGAHPASCTMGTGGPFPGVKRGRGVTLTTHPHPMPTSRMSRSYTSSPPSASVACSGIALAFQKWKNCNISNITLGKIEPPPPQLQFISQKLESRWNGVWGRLLRNIPSPCSPLTRTCGVYFASLNTTSTCYYVPPPSPTLYSVVWIQLYIAASNILDNPGSVQRRSIVWRVRNAWSRGGS